MSLYPQPTFGLPIDGSSVSNATISQSLPQELSAPKPIPGESKFVPVEIYRKVKADSLKLESDKQKLDMELAFAMKENQKLLYEAKMKDKVIEEYGLLEQSKRTRVESYHVSIQTETVRKIQSDLSKSQ